MKISKAIIIPIAIVGGALLISAGKAPSVSQFKKEFPNFKTKLVTKDGKTVEVLPKTGFILTDTLRDLIVHAKELKKQFNDNESTLNYIAFAAGCYFGGPAGGAEAVTFLQFVDDMSSIFDADGGKDD